MLAKLRTLPLAFWFLLIPLTLAAPMFVWMPRLIWGWCVFAAFASLPVLAMRWRTLFKAINWRWLAIAILAVAYTAASMLWSPSAHAYDRMVDLLYISACALMLFACWPALHENERRVLLGFFAAGWAASFVILVIELSCDWPMHRWFMALPADQPVAEATPKRTIALFALGIWPMAAWLKAQHRPRVMWGLLAFCAVGVVIASTRSARAGIWIGLLVMLAAYKCPQGVLRGLQGFVIVCLLAVVPLYLLIPQLPASVTDNLFPSAQARLDIWNAVANRVLEAPVIGHGIDSSAGLETAIAGEPGQTVIMAKHPHNVFLQLWLDFGLIGVVLWGALMVRLAQLARRAAPAFQPVLAGFMACGLVMLCTTYSIVQVWWLAGYICNGALFLLALQTASQPYIASQSGAINGTSAGSSGSA